MNWLETNDVRELINGCIKNNRKCQRILYERYYGKMMGVCIRYSKNREEAKDLLQDGFIKVFSNIANFGGNGSFEGWIRKIIVNNSIDYYRKKKKDLTEVNSEYFDNDHNDIIDYNDDGQDNEIFEIKTDCILNEIQKLTPAYKMVFNMYVMDGYTHKEISEILGTSEGTSKSNLAKAKINLRKALKKYLPVSV